MRRASPRSSHSASPRTLRKFKPGAGSSLWCQANPPARTGIKVVTHATPDTSAAIFEKPTTLVLETSTVSGSAAEKSPRRPVAKGPSKSTPPIRPDPSATHLPRLATWCLRACCQTIGDLCECCSRLCIVSISLRGGGGGEYGSVPGRPGCVGILGGACHRTR